MSWFYNGAFFGNSIASALQYEKKQN